ncbi:MAG: NAD+ synthase [Desulfobacterota bacterium]|jgi:NAD+ synthetase|nr:NAD+ synthase [Thermodesulfobacteriota bacterium]
MKIALCQINPIIGDFAHNTGLILDAVEQAKRAGGSLAVFPELSLMGYPPKDLLERPAFIKENLRVLDNLAAKVRGIHVLCGYVDRNPRSTGKALINAVALINDGRILGMAGKRLLPTYDVFDETRYFEPASESLAFQLEGKRIGVTVCEDIWNVGDVEGIPRYGLDPAEDLAGQGMDILVNLSASPYTLNKRAVRQKILEKISTHIRVTTLYCNQVGGNDDLLFDGASMVVDRSGKLILQGKEFEPDLLLWDSEKRYEELKGPWPTEEESVLCGLVMGTRDYVVKCGFKSVLIGLSGGIDSSLVAVIAQKAFGSENVTGVSMPSPYTSQMSRDDARTLARNLGIKFVEIPINDIFISYTRSLAEAFKGLPPDETEENIQARIRGSLLMALSNKFGAMLLSTGNKSETAVGYCTIYGDMNGGLAVISDIPKTLVYRLAQHINQEGEIIPARVIVRPPSAELRPNQTDQDSLPPYDVLDGILDAAIEKNLAFDDIVALGYDPSTVRDVLRRIGMNEYKRRQAAPGLKVTSKAFGYGRRYPIARGKEHY